MSIKHTLLGIASMAASLGAIGFLVFSDVAVAEEPPQAQAPRAAVQSKEAAPALKAKPKPRRKRIDLGRFEGY